MNRLLVLASVVATSLLAVQQANAQLNVSVTPSVGPNGFSTSGSYNAYANSALFSLSGGAVPGSAPGTGPAAYSPITGGMFSNNSLVSTGINSWMGQANPSGAFAGETGNQVYFGLAITGGNYMSGVSGTMGFTLASLGYAVNSTTDPGNLAFSSSGTPAPAVPLPSTFGPTLVGLDANGHWTNTAAGAGDNASTVLDALYYVGVSTGYDGTQPLNGSTPAATDQASLTNFINGIAAQNGGPVNISGTYTVTPVLGQGGTGGGVTGSSGVSGVVPEPASVAVLGMGVIGLLGYVYRRQRTVAVAA